MGLPIGSGMVESACKWLIQQRFKGVGMRWSEDGFNHLLHLRLAWLTLPWLKPRGFFIQRVHLLKAPCVTLSRGGSLSHALTSPMP
ncbi:hypothetical protein BWI75_24000 [Gloeocapsopsis sp. AAB1 = 1H9]|uniref:Uncharacterized protein n=1 Tax=Gloeocapsopsis dulcis AAB1 = 1H9 TaxID=1433147 RepID=A0A6N8G1Q9_9CHRO|nr:hypothetical protein [Gloeocapsopsis dulcis AAB1 = 1H9]